MTKRTALRKCLDCLGYKEMARFPYGKTGLDYEYVCIHCKGTRNRIEREQVAIDAWAAITVKGVNV